MKDRSEVVPETGEMDPDSCQAHACTVAEVEVDDETGVVEVLRMYSVYEVGRALNPAMVTQQVEGGAWMGISHALFETTEPYYPVRDHGPTDFTDYLMPAAADVPEQHSVLLERPAANGPFGAKGIVLSGGPASVEQAGAPMVDAKIFELGVPVLLCLVGLLSTLAATDAPSCRFACVTTGRRSSCD